MIRASNDLVFSATNVHSSGCGTPPMIFDDGTNPNYHGYFANRHGEQWLVTIDREAKAGVLRGGDIGWDEEIRIEDASIGGDLILGDDERSWLNACWLAACGEPLTA